MNETHNPHDAEHLHRTVWIAMIGLVTWFVLAIWSFGTTGYAKWLLVVVTGFLTIVVSLQLILSRVGRDSKNRPHETFRDWASGDFQTWQDRAKGSSAATEILLPIAAAAIGMTAIGLVFHYAAAHAPTFS